MAPSNLFEKVLPCTFHCSLRAKQSFSVLEDPVGCLGGFPRLKKIFFPISLKNFSVGIFLVIGVKSGKSSGMGEKIKRFKSESGEVEKE